MAQFQSRSGRRHKGDVDWPRLTLWARAHTRPATSGSIGLPVLAQLRGSPSTSASRPWARNSFGTWPVGAFFV
jgi:hypothetical protein